MANVSAEKRYSQCAAGTLVACFVAASLHVSGSSSILACVWVVKLLQSCQWCPAHAVMHKMHLQQYHQVSAQFEESRACWQAIVRQLKSLQGEAKSMLTWPRKPARGQIKLPMTAAT